MPALQEPPSPEWIPIEKCRVQRHPAGTRLISRSRELSLCVRDISQDEFRQPDHELAKPCILFEQRHDVIVGVLVIGIIVTPK